jgi:hypothetical protein
MKSKWDSKVINRTNGSDGASGPALLTRDLVHGEEQQERLTARSRAAAAVGGGRVRRWWLLRQWEEEEYGSGGVGKASAWFGRAGARHPEEEETHGRGPSLDLDRTAHGDVGDGLRG